MYNVIKAQIYQLKRSKSTYLIIFIALIFLVMGIVLELGSQGDDASASSMLMAMAESYVLFIPMITMAYTASICGGDLNDKTINYELLTGTDRRCVFFGRVLVSLTVNIIVTAFLLVVPVLIFTAFLGWGHTMSPEDAIMRCAATLFPLIRLTAFYAMLSFLIKSSVGVYAIGYILTFIEMVLMVFIEELFSTKALMYIMSVDLLDRILIPQNFRYGFFEEQDVMVVKDVMETSAVLHAAAAGIIGTAVFLFIGYKLFSKSDMD